MIAFDVNEGDLVPVTREMATQAAAVLLRRLPPAIEVARVAGKKAVDGAPTWLLALTTPPGATLAFLLQRHLDDRLPREWAAQVLAALDQAVVKASDAADLADLAEAFRRALQATQAPPVDDRRELVLERLAQQGLRGGMPPKAASKEPTQKRTADTAAVDPSGLAAKKAKPPPFRTPQQIDDQRRRAARAKAFKSSAMLHPTAPPNSNSDRYARAAVRAAMPAAVHTAPADVGGGEPIVVETPVEKLAYMAGLGSNSELEQWAKQCETVFLKNKSAWTKSAREKGYPAIDFGYHATRGKPQFSTDDALLLYSVHAPLPPITICMHCAHRCRPQRRP